MRRVGAASLLLVLLLLPRQSDAQIYTIKAFFAQSALTPLQRAALAHHDYLATAGERATDFSWLPKGAPPRNLLEQAVTAIVEVPSLMRLCHRKNTWLLEPDYLSSHGCRQAHIENRLVDVADVAGANWWVNVHDAASDTQHSHWHFDNDALAQNLLQDSSETPTPSPDFTLILARTPM